MYIRTDVAGALGELGKPIISFRNTNKVRTSVVSHGASHKAKAEADKLMNEVFESLGASNVALLDGREVELHIIPYDKQLTDLPEFQNRKGKRAPDGQAYDLLRATGGMESGPLIRYAIGEETIVKLQQKPSPFTPGFMVSHESARVVAQFALPDEHKRRLQEAFEERRRAVSSGAADWVGMYAGSNPQLYFASSTAAFFNHARRITAPDPARFTRVWLEKNDPATHALLTTVYERARR